MYVARGNVVLTQNGRTLRADRVYFSNRTRRGVASGNVVVEDGRDTLRAPFLEFDVDTIRGVVFDGELDSPKGGYRMQGREVRKTGADTWEFDGARFTTCRCPEPDQRDPWAIRADKATLDLEGYGRARNSTLEILGVPVMWLPYAVYPLGRERQTGFLFPQFGTSSRTGGDVTLPFFWAARDNVNVMLEGQYQLRRGFKPAGLVEYVYGETAEGNLYGTYIHDQDIDTDDPTTAFGPDRWGARWRHQQDLPFESITGVEAVAISDNQMPFDFADFRNYRRDRFLRSTGLVATHLGDSNGRFGVTFAGEAADDLQNPDDEDRDQFLLQRLPHLQLAALPGEVPGIPGLIVSSNLQLVNYQPFGDPDGHFDPALRVDDLFYDTGIDAIADGNERNAFGVKTAFDEHADDQTATRGGPEGDGAFQEGEPLADHGQRLLAQPRIAYPIQLGDVIEIYPEAGYSGTLYAADRAGFDHRSLFTGRVDVRSKLRGDVRMPWVGPLAHVFEPFVGWIGITQTDQDENPLFVPTTAVPQNRVRLLERDNWTLDPADRIEDANNVVFGVSNRFWRLGARTLQSEISLLAEYQAAEAQWGSAVLQGSSSLPYGISTRFHGVLDLDDQEFADGLVDVGWSRSGNSVAIGYRYVRDIPQVFENFFRSDRFEDFLDGFNRINQISGSVRVQATRSWALTYAGYYSFDNAISLVNQFGIEYLSKCACWAVRFEVSEDRTRGVDWTLQYRLVGLGEPPNRLFAR